MKLNKYNQAFYEALSIDKEKDIKNLKYQDIDEWDSIGHMTLISNIEEKLGVVFETDDIVDFSSYKKGIEILKKYEINLSK